MFKSLLKLIVGLGLFLGLAAPALAQNGPVQTIDSGQLLAAGLVVFLPLGLLLLLCSAVPEEQAPAAAINLLVVWAAAALAYFAIGFAFNFGGIAQVTPQPDLSGLYWEWYPLDQSTPAEAARLWGVVALRGWALAGEANRAGALLLFLSHLSLVGATAMLPAATLILRRRGAAAILSGALTGGVVYPLVSNWVWGGGWLSNLGASLELGHGFVDFGGAGVVFLVGGVMALAALIVFRPAAALAPETEPEVESEPVEPVDAELLAGVPLPTAYLPLLSVLGGGLLLVGWTALSTGAHTPTALNFGAAHAAVAGLLAALAAALTAAGYSWFTTNHVNPLLAGRGLAAGLVVATAGAPFLPIWLLVLAGGAAGLALPALIFAFDQKLWLKDELGTVATYAVNAAIGLLLVGLFANGEAGLGWNRVGLTGYAGVDGQGVTGWLPAAGFAADWPGQLQAQGLGLAVVLGWSLLAGLLLFQLWLTVANAARRSRPALPNPAEADAVSPD